MRQAITYGELDEMSKWLASWFQQKGLERVALMIPNVLSRRDRGGAARGVHPSSTSIRSIRRASSSINSKDSGAEAIVILENFAHTLQAVVKNTAIRHVVIASMGDLMGVKGLLVNFVVRRVKKLVPEWSLPAAARASTMHSPKARARNCNAPIRTQTMSRSSSTPAARQAWRKARRSRIAISSRTCCSRKSGSIPRESPQYRPVRLRRGASAVSHLRADGVQHAHHPHRGLGVLIPNPRDIAGTIKELKGIPYQHVPGGEHTLITRS